MDLKKYLTPKAQRQTKEAGDIAEARIENLSRQLQDAEAAASEQPEKLVPISSEGGRAATLENSSFDNLDFSMFKASLYSMLNMKKLSSNEVDVAVDPFHLFEVSKNIYPADQVTFRPYLATFREGGCNSGHSQVDLVFPGVETEYGGLPIIGCIIRAHASDLFKGSTLLHVKTNFIDVTGSLDDINSQGVFAFLFAKTRKNVDIQATEDTTDPENTVIKVDVAYADRDKSCIIDFPTSIQNGEVKIEADNMWLEIFPIVGSSMMRKLILQDISTQNFEILPNQLMKLI